MKKIIYAIIAIIIIILLYLLLFKKDHINSFDSKAIDMAKNYIKNNNIVVNGSLYIELRKLENNSDYLDCHNGSGVLIINNDNKLEYHSYLSCNNYITKINSDNSKVTLNGQEILILNNGEKYIEPGFSSLSDVTTTEREYDHIKYIYYYAFDSGKVIDTVKRVVIYTDDKNKDLNGNDNDEYPIITLNEGNVVKSFYNSRFTDPGYKAMDKYDGDITNKVEVEGKVDNTEIGSYILTYRVMNSKGNYTTVERNVEVINNEVDFTTDLSLSTKEINPQVDIILKIIGDGYNYTILPNDRISKEKEITYQVNENKTYKFKVYDINDNVRELEIKVDNIGEMPKKIEKYSLDYPQALTLMQKIPKANIANYFASKGFMSNDGENYKLVINGENISYNISSGRLSYGSDYVICDFYATSTSVLGSMSNTITILAGSGERSSGAIGSSHIPSNANLNDNSILIAPRKDSEYNMSKHPGMISACTKLGMFLAGIEKGNSIIGYSEGAQAASRTVSYNKVKYDTIVLVNGSAFYTSNNENLISNYTPFIDMEIILLEAKSNNNWNETIIKTVNNFLRNGVNSSNIKMFTCDSELIKTFSNSIELTIVPNGAWSGHGSGYKIIRESNILSYLSNK